MTGRPAWRAAVAAGVALLLALVVAACTGGDDGEDSGPAPTPRPMSPPTTRVDLSGVVLGAVPGETTTSVATSGRAAIVGTVRGPGGPVAGATVRIERLGAGGSTIDAIANEAGDFEARGIPGGRYRVRAFAPPALAQQGSEVRFLADAQEHRFDLDVVDRSGPVVSASAAPDPTQLDQPVNLVVQVATRRVDGDGVVVTEPVPGLAVELEGLGRWQLRTAADPTTTQGGGDTPGATTTIATSSATATTDQAGRARWELVCRAPGAPGLSVRFAVRIDGPPSAEPPAGGEGDEAPATTAAPATRTEVVPLELPTCMAPAPTTTDDGEGDGDGEEDDGSDVDDDSDEDG